MNVKTYLNLSSVIFALVAVAHLLRMVAGWEVSIHRWDVPMWASAAAAVVAGFLSFAGFRASQQMQKFMS